MDSLLFSEVRKGTLHYVITRPVDSRMIRRLAVAADNVIPCDKNMMPPPPHKAASLTSLPTPPTTLQLSAVQPEVPILPTVELFIWWLVESSNVQAATLLPTLVYLDRFKSRLHPTSRGVRCTCYRIFLACLILAAKYVNDISPKNQHWAQYTALDELGYQFGFCTSEVNLMEKQVLQLLDWDLRVDEADLYESWADYFALICGELAFKNRRQSQEWCHRNINN